MPREKTKAEIDNENRARAGMNALNRLGVAVKYLPTPYAKPVFDLILDAKRAVQLNEKYRSQIVFRAKGMTDILAFAPVVGTDGMTALAEIVHMVGAICTTESANWIEGQDIAGLVSGLDQFKAAKDPF